MNTHKYLLVAIFSVATAVYVSAQNPAPPVAPAGAPGAQAPGAPGAPARGGGAPQAPDTSTPDPIARPANGKALITEDFESAQIDAKKWAMHVTGEQTLALTKEKVAHGQQALKVVLPAGKAGGTTWAMIGTMLPASLKDHFYGRAYMYISGPAQAHNVYMNAGSTGFPISDFLEIGFNGGNFMTSYQQNAPADGHPRSEVTSRQGLVPFGKWFCLEWEMINKPEDRIALWVDGQLVSNKAWTFNPVSRDPDPALKVNSGLVPTGFVEYNVGYRAWSRAGGNTEDIVVYYDDIAIGDKPIGQLTPVK
jgi:hypothetical protein